MKYIDFVKDIMISEEEFNSVLSLFNNDLDIENFGDLFLDNFEYVTDLTNPRLYIIWILNEIATKDLMSCWISNDIDTNNKVYDLEYCEDIESLNVIVERLSEHGWTLKDYEGWLKEINDYDL